VGSSDIALKGTRAGATWQDRPMRRALLVLLSLVALVGAGCGDGDGGSDGATSKQDYGRELSRATAGLQQAFEELRKSTSEATTVKASGERLAAGATALEKAADNFEGIEPPKASTAAHRKLVEGLNDLATVFRRGADAAKRNDAKGLQEALAGLTTSKGVREITEAQRELERQGVKVTTTAG
jgi:hypothetical protein